MCKEKEVHAMKLEEMQELLSEEYEIIDIEEVQHGHKISLQNGAIVNVFNKGTYNVQGKRNDEVKAYIEEHATDAQKISRPNRRVSNKVFVVYGHDDTFNNLDANSFFSLSIIFKGLNYY